MRYLFLTSLKEDEINTFQGKSQEIIPREKVENRIRVEQLKGEQIQLVRDVVRKLLEIQNEIEQLSVDMGNECKKCHSLWKSSKKVDKCPFCGEYLEESKSKILEKGWVLEDSVLTVALPWFNETFLQKEQRRKEWAKAKKLVLYEGITEIEKQFFKGLDNLEEIVFPTTLKKIGYASFQDCIKLRKIELPEGMTMIAADAFRNCKGLNSIGIPDTVKYIGNEAFYNCTASPIYVAKDCMICQGNYQVRNRTKVV